jgi:hypothetical protein
MNDLGKKNSGLPATDQANPFEEYGNAATARGGIEGTLLKFNKGDYLAGQEGEEVPLGTQFAARVDKLLVGWVCWQDNVPVDKQHMGLVADRYQPPRRNELGDLDKANWEINANGQAQDPWQLTNYLPLRRIDNGELYTFATNSKGGLSAIGELCKDYGKMMRQRPDENPVIALDASSYLHRDRSIGRVHVPVLNNIVDWVAKDDDDDSGGDAANEPPWSPSSDTTASSASRPAATEPAAASPATKPAATKSTTASSTTKPAAAKPIAGAQSRF